MANSLDKAKLLTAFEVSEPHMREVLKRGVTVAVSNFERRAVEATQRPPLVPQPIQRDVKKFDPGAQAGRGIAPFDNGGDKPAPRVEMYFFHSADGLCTGAFNVTNVEVVDA